ncbi:IclR family transcriptional regulator [Streptomyces sp. NPDC102381]|uniref:IclR family transcriptional regulator n=1 Tax=Streptomyces sp. NPDC102381 TaxID=3366164 RepID=UPI0038097EAB
MSDDMLGRGLRLLTTLSRHPEGLGVSAAARVAQLPVSSAHRLLARMTEEGFVVHDSSARTYALGLRALELAHGFHRTPAGFNHLLGPMRQLAERTGLVVIAGILDGDQVLLVRSVQGSQHLQLRSDEGTRNPWHATSLGKALVAARPEADQERLLAGPLPRSAPNTLSDPDELRAELARVRELGWAEAEEENERGVRSIALCVPAADPDGGPPQLALSLGATVVLTGREELHDMVPLLRTAAREAAAYGR